ncbi:MAG TPA: rhomboid family intramembrane serine protease [Solirubrobacteraceae bacterium]|jgi:membrane associated rhomboid family serine protease
MADTPAQRTPDRLDKYQTQVQGLVLLGGIVLLMWVLEIVNTLDSNGLDTDGIWGRNLGRLWGIFTAPFLHASFAHLIANTIPFVFMGVIIALHGAKRLALVTLIVVLVGGIGTWLIAPSNVPTIGASGVVFGYATYLLVRGLFDRSVLEVFVGIVVGVVWGGALISSVVPHYGVSWQGHVCGAIGGVVAAYALRTDRPAASEAKPETTTAAGALPG